jgi:ankyrin repeat protein
VWGFARLLSLGGTALSPTLQAADLVGSVFAFLQAAMKLGAEPALHTAAAQELLSADSSIALLTSGADDGTALHLAAGAGHESDVRALIDTEPSTLLAVDALGRLPLHHAIVAGDAAMVRLLLAAAPEAARHLNAFPNACCCGATPLHWAAYDGQPDIVAALLVAAPETAAWSSVHGHAPVHLAVMSSGCEAGESEAVPHNDAATTVRLLLSAAPTMAAAADSSGDTPLHYAAASGCQGLLAALLEAAPSAAAVPNQAGQLPIDCSLAEASDRYERGCSCSSDGQLAAVAETCCTEQRQLGALLSCAAALLPCTPTAHLLKSLAAAGPVASPLYAQLAAARQLSVTQWEQVPASCPGLGAALPAVVARSTEEAACLVHRLPAEERDLLHTTLKSLAGSQAQLGVDPPREVAWQALDVTVR